jgi:hypothetical protein
MLIAMVSFAQEQIACPAPSKEVFDRSDTIFRKNTRETYALTISKRPRTYYGATFRNIEQPFSKGFSLISCPEKLMSKLNFKNKFIKISAKRNISKNEPYYMEVRQGLYTSW